jgi:hypothetical protein
LTLETCRVIHIEIENKNLSQVASVGLLIGIYEDARARKHKKGYRYVYKLGIGKLQRETVHSVVLKYSW